MANSAIQILDNCKHKVWPEVQKYLNLPTYPTEFSVPEKYTKDVDYVLKTISEYPNRQGKYLRPTLLYLTARALGANLQTVVSAAAAMQISEEWILIHDDLEDDSLERRGKPALHRQFSPELAINAGDALHAIMWKAVRDTGNQLQPDVNNNFFTEFYNIISRTIIGQGVETKWTQENKLDFSDEDWYFIADSKSVYYTIAGPLRLGAILAQATPFQLEKLTKFGLALGRCFQLVDDVLDLTSDFAGLKKQKGNDIYEGKRTIPLGYLLRNSSGSTKRRLVNILSKTREQKTENEVAWVIAQMESSGSISYANKLASRLKDEALNILDKDISFFKDSGAKKDLEVLTEFILNRTY
jgi:geranylgeranyl diphosphate synthase type II